MLNLVPVKEIKLVEIECGKYVFYNHTYFQRGNYDGQNVELRCVIASPQYGYGEGSIVSFPADTFVSLAEELRK